MKSILHDSFHGECAMAVALVTGASGTRSGIGLSTAITLARAGHTIIATMRNLDSAGELPSIITNEQLPVSMLALDVEDDASVARVFEQVLNEHGRIDVLINNAGIGGPGTVDETPLSSFRQIMETNYFGELRCIKAVLPSMVARRSGCIINVSSVVGRIAISPQAPYAASKHALEAMSECLAQEVKSFNVRVAIVEPGPIATPMAQRILTGQPKSAYPQGRRLAALFARFLKQPSSPYVVGEQIRQIVESDSWQLRYPAGPYAPLVFKWRQKTSDEEWVSLFGGSDTEFVAGVKRGLGLDVTLQ
jgi:NAD(P)-dependent dehydrogenase (short-subunit alcohol dehydrogenase family)